MKKVIFLILIFTTFLNAIEKIGDWIFGDKNDTLVAILMPDQKEQDVLLSIACNKKDFKDLYIAIALGDEKKLKKGDVVKISIDNEKPFKAKYTPLGFLLPMHFDKKLIKHKNLKAEFRGKIYNFKLDDISTPVNKLRNECGIK